MTTSISSASDPSSVSIDEGPRPLDAAPATARSLHRPTLLIANPSADVYGADLQMLQTVSAMRGRGWRVVVVIPEDGPLVPRLTVVGADVRFVPFPVLRRAGMSARGVLTLGRSAMRTLRALRRCIQDVEADVVYVNTITIPWWLAAARTTRTPVVCHVHEADARPGSPIGLALNSPLFLANSVIVNGTAALNATTHDLPRLIRRTTSIPNGISQPNNAIRPVDTAGPFRLAVVGRLSPRKATNEALETIAILRRAGRDVYLDVCGTPFDGYEWFEEDLRQRATKEDLNGAVTFSGYASPIWPALQRSHAVVAPCASESFGNAVVEAQLAGRPVIAVAAGGHLDTVIDEESGLLVPPHDPIAMAAAVARLMDDPELAQRLASCAAQRAAKRFSTTRYDHDIARLIGALSR